MPGELIRDINPYFNYPLVKEQMQFAIRSGRYDIKSRILSRMGKEYIICAIYALEDEINILSKTNYRFAKQGIDIDNLRAFKEKLEAELNSRYERAS